MTALLELRNFGLRLDQGRGFALTEAVSMRVDAGEIVGLVGESGSGKSVTARSAIGLYPGNSQTSGELLFDGRDVSKMTPRELTALRRHDVSMIFQNPRAALDPVRTIGHFLAETLVRHDGLPATEASIRAADAMAEVGISHAERRMAQYPHELSGGMLQRVMICAALLSGARLLLADEATTALDVTTQAEVMALLHRLRVQRGLGTLLITHDLELAKVICDRIYVMYAGRILEAVPAKDFDQTARHPYTRALLAARPSLNRRVHRLAAIPGRTIGASEVAQRCAFLDRCPLAVPICRAAEPAMQAVAANHLVRCVRSDPAATTGCGGVA